MPQTKNLTFYNKQFIENHEFTSFQPSQKSNHISCQKRPNQLTIATNLTLDCHLEDFRKMDNKPHITTTRQQHQDSMTNNQKCSVPDAQGRTF